MNENTQKQSNYYGLTTGSIATAASLAALKSIIAKDAINSVEIDTPFDKINVAIESFEKLTDRKGKASAVKYPYNDPDVTVNAEIIAIVELIAKKEYENEIGGKIDYKINDNVIVTGGKGVGTVTKSGLHIPLGKPAINPIPLDMIKSNLKKHVPPGKIAKVEITVPNGESIAKKTMNPRLGIVGGISILGTTGIARAMSSKAYKESLTCQFDIAIGGGYDKNSLIFVPGNIGEKFAVKSLAIERDQVIQMGNFVRFMFEEAKKRGVTKITLFGHIGKLVKIAGGIFNTKHSIADGRKEIIAAHGSLYGAQKDTVEEIFNSKTTEEMIAILKKNNLAIDVLNSISLAIKSRCLDEFDIDVNVIIIDMKGNRLNSI